MWLQVAAQCCHAAVHCVGIAMEEAPGMRLLERWEESNGTAKVALKCETEEQLLAIAKKAEEAGMVHSVIQDAGRTQIAAGSTTVCGIGPAKCCEIDAICGHLKLL